MTVHAPWLAALAGIALAGTAASQPSALAGAQALAPVFDALSAASEGRRDAPVQILQIGDSHTAADHIASALRSRLQARFGAGGRGVLPPGVPFAGYAPRQVQVEASAGWRLDASFPLAERGAGRFGLSGWRLTSTAPGASVVLHAEPEARFDRAAVCAEARPGAGLLTVAAGPGRAAWPLATAAVVAPVCRAFSFAPPQVRLELTGEGGPVTLLSFATGRRAGGVSLSNLGVSGAALADFAARDDLVLAAEMDAYAPDLIVVAFGTNEGFDTDLDPAAYEHLVRRQIHRLRRLAPRSAVLLLGPPDAETIRPDIAMDGVADRGFGCAPLTPAEAAAYPRLVAERSPALARWYAPPRLAEVREAQRRAAARAGAAFWDWSARMGGDCSAHRLSRPEIKLVRGDHIHFTTAGGDRVGALLFEDLMAAWSVRRRSGG